MKKSIQLEIEKAKEEIVNKINEISNNHNLDYYFLFFIIKEIYRETEIKKDEELQNLKNSLNKGVEKDV